MSSVKKKALLTLICFIAVYVIYFFVNKRRHQQIFKMAHITGNASFDYFYFSCSIFNSKGKLIFKAKSGYLLCAFRDDGSYFAAKAAEDKFTYFDARDEVIWTATDHIHHQIKLTPDNEKLLIISSELMDYKKQKLRSDCFSVRNFKNEKEHEWCLKDHLDELKKIGFKFGPEPSDTSTISPLIYAKDEIVHANSIYQIQENSLASLNPAFQKGNYLVNFWDNSGLVLVLDKNLEKILWHMNSRSIFKSGFHDLQLTPEGHLLFYLNQNPLDNTKKFYSSLVEADALTFEKLWTYEKNPKEKFAAEFMGSIQVLPNGNILYSDTTNGGQAFEITKPGLEVWSFTNPERDYVSKIPIEVPEVRVFDHLNFLKAHQIDYE